MSKSVYSLALVLVTFSSTYFFTFLTTHSMFLSLLIVKIGNLQFDFDSANVINDLLFDVLFFKYFLCDALFMLSLLPFF